MTNSPRLIAANNRASSAESGLSAGALVLPPDGAAQGFRDFGQGGRFIHVGQPVQIALVGGLAELGPAMGVGHAFAQGQRQALPPRASPSLGRNTFMSRG